MPTSSKQIQQVREMIKTGKKKQAVNELVRLIEKDHDNPELWWLLANASEDPHQARRALDEMQMLAPKDTRAEKMLKRLDTRIKLDQMGLQSGQKTNPNRRVMMYGGGVVALLIVLVTGVFALSGGFNRQAEGEATPPDLATRFIIGDNGSTQTALIVTETQSPAETELPEPTSTTIQDIPPTTIQGLPPAEVTVDVQPPTVEVRSTLPLPTANQQALPTLELPTSAPTNTQVPPPTANLTPVMPIDGTQSANTGNPVLSAESTAEVRPGESSPTPFGTPFTFIDASPTPFGTPFLGIVTPTSIPTTTPLDRGQVVDGTPRRDLIAPYGVHSYTFSGYRDEKITLELRNLSGEGNPSLELKNVNGELVASDIDVTSAQNLDAHIELNLPGDGIYTVIVRMASVKEQLYYLSLKRG
jgi:hypothetical protein